MKNYYYVLSMNLSNPRVKAMLERFKISAINESMIDFKIRSQLYMGFAEAQDHAYEDFDKKIEHLYDDDEKHYIKNISVINPKYALPSDNLMQSLANRFSPNADSWADNCCNVVFFVEMHDEDDEEIHPNDWMLKYEILFSDDGIELPGNGDFAVFNSTTSSYHRFLS